MFQELPQACILNRGKQDTSSDRVVLSRQETSILEDLKGTLSLNMLGIPGGLGHSRGTI